MKGYCIYLYNNALTPIRCEKTFIKLLYILDPYNVYQPDFKWFLDFASIDKLDSAIG